VQFKEMTLTCRRNRACCHGPGAPEAGALSLPGSGYEHIRLDPRCGAGWRRKVHNRVVRWVKGLFQDNQVSMLVLFEYTFCVAPLRGPDEGVQQHLVALYALDFAALNELGRLEWQQQTLLPWREERCVV
jgi:hypothetical protein